MTDWVKVKPVDMTEQEQRIWAAVYAARFQAEVKFFQDEGSLPFDTAIRRADVEGCTAIADAAVVRLRAWNASGNIDYQAGTQLMDEHPPDWTK